MSMTASCARIHSHVSTVRPKGKSVARRKHARSYAQTSLRLDRARNRRAMS